VAELRAWNNAIEEYNALAIRPRYRCVNPPWNEEKPPGLNPAAGKSVCGLVQPLME
jgi:hypothetical protein